MKNASAPVIQELEITPANWRVPWRPSGAGAPAATTISLPPLGRHSPSCAGRAGFRFQQFARAHLDERSGSASAGWAND